MLSGNLKDIVYGKEEEFGLRETVFHQICFLSAIALGFGQLLAVYIRQWDLALSILSALFILTLAYWFSRVMKKFMVGWVLYLVISYLIFTINYFLNSGINGTTIIMSFVSVAMLYATSSSKNHWIWTSLHGLLFSGLLLYELSFGGTHHF
jgi:two-component system sensor histidine kinase/response regulator